MKRYVRKQERKREREREREREEGRGENCREPEKVEKRRDRKGPRVKLIALEEGNIFGYEFIYFVA